MSALELGPATRATAVVVAGVGDDQLGGPTPCPDWTVGDLLDHIGGLSYAFTVAARKEVLEPHGPSADGSRLESGWRDRITAALDELAASWREPGAFEGRTMAGPVEMAADEAALVALNEVVVHGWDLARATGQTYDPDPVAAELCVSFVAAFDAPAGGPADDSDDGGLFGAPVRVAADAPALDRLVGATGRRPDWTR